MKFITFGIISALVILIAVQETHSVVLASCKNPERFRDDRDRSIFCRRVNKCYLLPERSDEKKEATDKECDKVRPGLSNGNDLSLGEFCKLVEECYNTRDVHDSDFDSIISDGAPRIFFWDNSDLE